MIRDIVILFYEENTYIYSFRKDVYYEKIYDSSFRNGNIYHEHYMLTGSDSKSLSRMDYRPFEILL